MFVHSVLESANDCPWLVPHQPFVVKNLEAKYTRYPLLLMLPTVRERSTHSSTTKTVFASRYPDSELLSVQPVSELSNYCPVSSSSVSTSRFRSRPPSLFRSRPPSRFEAVHLAGFEVGHYLAPVMNQVSPLQSWPAGFETGWPASKQAGLQIGP